MVRASLHGPDLRRLSGYLNVLLQRVGDRACRRERREHERQAVGAVGIIRREEFLVMMCS